jgi:hypothetical protein
MYVEKSFQQKKIRPTQSIVYLFLCFNNNESKKQEQAFALWLCRASNLHTIIHRSTNCAFDPTICCIPHKKESLKILLSHSYESVPFGGGGDESVLGSSLA